MLWPAATTTSNPSLLMMTSTTTCPGSGTSTSRKTGKTKKKKKEAFVPPGPCAFLSRPPARVHHFCLLCFDLVVHFMLSCLSSRLAVLTPWHPSFHFSVSSSSSSSSSKLIRPSPSPTFHWLHTSHQPAFLTHSTTTTHQAVPCSTLLPHTQPSTFSFVPDVLLLEEINPAFHLSRMVSSSLSMKYMWKSNCTINFCLPFFI